MTERLSDGIKVWDLDRQHYATFRSRGGLEEVDGCVYG
jgi:hypothetical protein